ncbi:MAG: thiamine pyrophosphate-dependent dehydrogenase E1 component subunit alpha [Actinobacteria bacterium]|nr:thiamine pyrophosphate-dependent dehydrogenase E1 component subunit alpha [Actinomycetota bacterium]
MEPIIQGEVKCPCHLCSGQEAIAVGVCASLDEKDYIFGTHRSHGHYLAKGGGMPELIAEIYGKQTGCSRGRGGSMHLIAPDKGVMGAVPIVGGTISLAVGAALASKIRKENRVTVSFFGDGASGEGVLYESLNFASLKRLPIIFACENNLYSTHMPIKECRSKNNIFEIGNSFCIPSYRVDGNDVLKVYELTKKAVEKCKENKGPVFIEFMTYRLRGHVGADDNIQGNRTDIRPNDEIEEWKRKDPLKKFEKFLLENGFLTKENMEIIKKEIEEEVRNAYVFAQNSPYPEKSELINHVFKE